MRSPCTPCRTVARGTAKTMGADNDSNKITSRQTRMGQFSDVVRGEGPARRMTFGASRIVIIDIGTTTDAGIAPERISMTGRSGIEMRLMTGRALHAVLSIEPGPSGRIEIEIDICLGGAVVDVINDGIVVNERDRV